MYPSTRRTFMMCFAIVVGFSQFGLSQEGRKSIDGIWQKTEGGKSVELFSLYGDEKQPHSTLVLNAQALDRFLGNAPKEFSDEAKSKTVVISLPLPNGTFEKFRIAESPVVEAPLGSPGFESHTFAGVGIDDPTATVRFESAFDGFHAMVRTAAGVFYIDPVRGPEKTESYFSYFPPSKSKSNDDLHCVVSEDRTQRDRQNGAQKRSSRMPETFRKEGTHLKEYRLALAANSFYVNAVYNSKFAASKFDQAASAIVRTIDRVNQIYAVDLGVKLVLVKDESKLIFVDRDKDPYKNVNADADNALELNQKVIDSIIGDKNYDIGHLFTTKTAGLARLQAACGTGVKARGVTGLSTPTGDNFDVDYVAHEIGHQFGANHTFNGTSGSCHGNRNPKTAYEPGSGSTVMGYAGICDPESVQPHSDPYFHVASLWEVNEYIGPGGGGDACGSTRTISSSSIPPITVHSDFFIPKATPFVLTVNLPRASPDISYTWEEFDLGDASPPNTEDGPTPTPRPLFRSILPGGSATRYFPDSQYLFQSSLPIGEAFPMLTRTLSFQVTVRDNHGGISVAQQHVKVQSSSGPFQIKPLVGGAVWELGSTHKIDWDVAGTDKSPISCDHLKVTLVIDGQVDSRVLLSDNVANTGSATLTIPNHTPVTTHGRLMLESQGNIFFAISPYELQLVRR